MKLILLAASACLIAAPALASDLVYVDDQQPVVFETEAPAVDWTGFYLGIYGGAADGDMVYDAADDAFPYLGNLRGGFGGLQTGFNFQVSDALVLGAVADLGVTTLQGSAGGGGATLVTDLQYLGSVRAKLGYAMDRLLAYVHGGAAFGGTDSNASLDSDGIPFSNFHGGGHFGYTLGAGLEYKVSDAVSVFGEYAYTDLGSTEVFTNPPGTPAFTLYEILRYQSIKGGINFHF